MGPAFSGENFAKYPEKSLRKKKNFFSRRVTKKNFFFFDFCWGSRTPGTPGVLGSRW